MGGALPVVQCCKEREDEYNYSNSNSNLSKSCYLKTTLSYNKYILSHNKGLSEIEKKDIDISDDYKIHLDNFELIKVLGKGAYGKVVLVQEKKTKCIYAMKIMRKDQILQEDQRLYTVNERLIMEQIQFPFLVKLHYAFQSYHKLYMVMDFMQGGELFFHLRNFKKFSEAQAKFYASEIILAIEYLHKNNVIYRDLKPENVLLDTEGHIKLTDFGLAKLGGALLYEMVSGERPFYDKNYEKMFENVLKPQNRLGFGPKDGEEIKSHSFFAKVDWKAILNKEIIPPFTPIVSNAKDTRHFDKNKRSNESIGFEANDNHEIKKNGKNEENQENQKK